MGFVPKKALGMEEPQIFEIGALQRQNEEFHVGGDQSSRDRGAVLDLFLNHERVFRPMHCF